MQYILRTLLMIFVIPITALTGLAFKCVRIGVGYVFSAVGWELAWPPVLVDDLPDLQKSVATEDQTFSRRPSCRARVRNSV